MGISQGQPNFTHNFKPRFTMFLVNPSVPVKTKFFSTPRLVRAVPKSGLATPSAYRTGRSLIDTSPYTDKGKSHGTNHCRGASCILPYHEKASIAH